MSYLTEKERNLQLALADMMAVDEQVEAGSLDPASMAYEQKVGRAKTRADIRDLAGMFGAEAYTTSDSIISRKFSDTEIGKASATGKLPTEDRGLDLEARWNQEYASAEQIAKESEDRQANDILMEPGLPSKADYEKKAQDEVKKRGVWTVTASEVLGEAFDLNDKDALSKLLKPEFGQLNEIETKISRLKDDYDKAKEELGDEEGKAAVFALFAHLAVGAYGIKHGLDTNGVKFNMIDWDNKYKKLEKKFDLDMQMQREMTSLIKDRISNKRSVFNEAQQIAAKQERDIEKITDAQYTDAMQKYYEQKRDFDEKKKEGRVGQQASEQMAIMEFEARSKQEAGKSKLVDQEISSVDSSLKNLTAALKLKKSSAIKTSLEATLPADLLARLEEEDYDKDAITAVKREIEARKQSLLEDKNKIIEQAKLSAIPVIYMKTMVKDQIADGDPVGTYKEFSAFRKDIRTKAMEEGKEPPRDNEVYNKFRDMKLKAKKAK
jgi:hypothetical protein